MQFPVTQGNDKGKGMGKLRVFLSPFLELVFRPLFACLLVCLPAFVSVSINKPFCCLPGIYFLLFYYLWNAWKKIIGTKMNEMRKKRSQKSRITREYTGKSWGKYQEKATSTRLSFSHHQQSTKYIAKVASLHLLNKEKRKKKVETQQMIPRSFKERNEQKRKETLKLEGWMEECASFDVMGSGYGGRRLLMGKEFLRIIHHTFHTQRWYF